MKGPREQAEFASELFMGCRLRCANCHNHPFDHWTQDDYHGLAAIFAKVKGGVVVNVSARGEVTHPRTGEAALRRIPGDANLDTNTDGREALADWLTSPHNPYLSKAIVNRLWKALMGRGLVEPTDDLRDTNPATHPLLLDQLATDFVKHDYDLRHTLRLIALSAAYARSTTTTSGNEADSQYYSHAFSRPLEPEVLADAISDVIGLHDQYGDESVGTRAVALVDPKTPSEALDVLGRCSREETCETSATSTGRTATQATFAQRSLINRRLADPQGRLALLIAAEKTPAEIVDELYLRALGRHPTPAERGFWREQLSVVDRQQVDQQKLLEDFV